MVSARDVVRAVAAQQQGALDAVAAGLVQQVVEERPASDFKQRLGRGRGEIAQATADAADQEDRLIDGHAAADALATVHEARHSSLSSRAWSAKPQFSGWVSWGRMPCAHCSAGFTKLRSIEGAGTVSTPATLRLG